MIPPPGPLDTPRYLHKAEIPPTRGILSAMPKELGYGEPPQLRHRRVALIQATNDSMTTWRDMEEGLDEYDAKGWEHSRQIAERDPKASFASIGFLALRATLHQHVSVRHFEASLRIASAWAHHEGARSHGDALDILLGQVAALARSLSDEDE